MMSHQVLATELLKLRRSKITWMTWLVMSIMPLVGGLFMWIVMEPERAAQLGLIGQKAQLAGLTADWTSFFQLMLQIVGVGGMILAAVITAYVFGREYVEGTAGDMLTLPVSRHHFAVAKLIVVMFWFGLLTLWLIIESLVVCWYLKLPGYSAAMLWTSTGEILLTALVAWLLVPVVAFVSLVGRGYMAPIGFAIFAMIMGIIFGATGWGKWFPWSIVPLFAGIAGPRVEHLVPASIMVLLLTSVAGVAAVILELRYADVRN